MFRETTAGTWVFQAGQPLNDAPEPGVIHNPWGAPTAVKLTPVEGGYNVEMEFVISSRRGDIVLGDPYAGKTYWMNERPRKMLRRQRKLYKPEPLHPDTIAFVNKTMKAIIKEVRRTRE